MPQYSKSHLIVTPDGEPAYAKYTAPTESGSEPVPVPGTELLAHKMIQDALLGDQGGPGKRKYELGQVVAEIGRGRGAFDLSLEQVATAREVVGTYYAPWAVFQLWNYLDNPLNTPSRVISLVQKDQ